MSQQLDRSKPLWEIWVVEGLSDGRFALISKTHHCVVDGVSGADIMSVVLDLGPEGAEPEEVAIKAWRPLPEPTSDQLLIDAIRERVTSPGEVVRTLQSAAGDPGGLPNRLIGTLKALSEFVGSGFAAPTSSLNRSIGPHRRFETVLADLDQIKAIKNHYGGTVNDVVLSVVSGGLRRLLKARGESVDEIELRAMVPVSVRRMAAEEPSATRWQRCGPRSGLRARSRRETAVVHERDEGPQGLRASRGRGDPDLHRRVGSADDRRPGLAPGSAAAGVQPRRHERARPPARPLLPGSRDAGGVPGRSAHPTTRASGSRFSPTTGRSASVCSATTTRRPTSRF